MKTILLVTALAGTAFAHESGSIARRQIVDVKPEIKDDTPEECRKALEAFNSAGSPQPTIFAEASSSFYETASRTATETYEDCEWITNMPDAAATAWVEWEDKNLELLKDKKNVDLFKKADASCKEYNEGLRAKGEEALCEAEWKDFYAEALEKTGWTPDVDALADALGKSDESAASGVQAHAAAALLAVFMGAVVL